MRNILTIVSILLFVLFSFSIVVLTENELRLSPNDHKKLIDSVGKLLEENYLFPEKGKEMTKILRKNLENGEYSKITDPKLFAKKMTYDLQKISSDKHFGFSFNPRGVKDYRTRVTSRSEEEIREIQERIKNSRKLVNFGFKRVEILDGNVGYLDLRRFDNLDFAASTAEGAMSFLANSDAIIIDLRYNPGGGASMYQFLVSYFFDSDPVHLFDLINRRSDTTTQYYTLPHLPGKRLPDVDLFILTSKVTFSAAEQFTYDLQALKRAIVVGEPTGGGAHMTTRMPVDDNFLIFIPFAGAFNPITKTNWEGIGIQPNVKVKSEQALNTAYILALKSILKKTTSEKRIKKLEKIITDTSVSPEN